LTLVTYILNGHCSSSGPRNKFLNGNPQNDLPYSSGCNTALEFQISEGYLALLLVCPTLLSMIVKSVKSETVFFSWVLTVLSLVGMFYQFDLHESVLAFVAIAFISFLQLFEFQRQKISMYFLSQKLRGIQTENERLEKDSRNNELKHLIGNVAHDLKTV
jgi:predicted membrane protein